MTETSKRRCVSAAAQAQGGGGGGRGRGSASDAWRRAAEALAARRDAAAREFGAVAARDAAVAALHSFSESVSRRAHGRNRYRDVLPYDANQVRLPPSVSGGAAAAGGGSGSGGGGSGSGSGTSSCGPTTVAAAATSDYINASHVEVRLHVPDAPVGLSGRQQEEDDDPLVTAALAAVPPATPPPGAAPAASSAAAIARYVATQGPLPSTCGDFWAMVASLGSPAVVMLTNAVERGVCKCHPYFPEEAATAEEGEEQGAGKAAAAKVARGQRGGSSNKAAVGGAPTAELHLPSRGLSVRCVRVSRGIPPEAAWAAAAGSGGGGGRGGNHDNDSSDDIVVRRLQLRCASSGAVLHELDHYHLRAWPDHGVPQGPEGAAPVRGLCRALELSRQQWRRRLQEGPTTAAEPPVVVHCSAGIGRTGTFCAVDVLLRRMWALGGGGGGGGSSCLAEEEDGEEEGAAAAAAGRPPPPQLTLSPLLLDVPSLVVALRAQRAGMVQTLEQYSYISEAALEEAEALAEGRAAPPGAS